MQGSEAFNPSGRFSIQFVANIASSLSVKFTRSRKSLNSVNCRCCGARIEITFAFEIQSPRTERSCHSVEPIAHANPVQTQVVARDRQKNPRGLPASHRKRAHRQWYFFKHKIFPDSGPKIRTCMLAAENSITCYGQAQTVLLPCNFLSGWCIWQKRSETSQLPWFFSPLTKSLAVPVLRSFQFSFLRSQIYWCCDHASLTIKYGTQMGMVREQLPDIG